MTLPHASDHRDLTEGELGWIAGMIDGEGSLGVTSRGSVRFMLRIAMTDRSAIDHLARLIGGRVTLQTQRPPRRPAWCWYCRQRDLRSLLLAVLPLLVFKRIEASTTLRFLRA